MDTSMAISGETIKSLREARAWSQAHLAEAAGLSLRTVQRVEAEGTASAETRLALAGALGVAVDALNASQPTVEPDPSVGVPVVFGCSALVLVFVIWVGSGMPSQVASHSGVAGDANATMSRDAFVALMGLMAVVLPNLMLAGVTLAARHGKVNIPNAGFWLAPARRAATLRWLHRHVSWLAVGMSLTMGWLTWLVAVANRVTPPTLDPRWLVAGLGVVLAATTVWIVVLQRHFARSA